MQNDRINWKKLGKVGGLCGIVREPFAIDLLHKWIGILKFYFRRSPANAESGTFGILYSLTLRSMQSRRDGMIVALGPSQK
jgi:hypothetical protein